MMPSAPSATCSTSGESGRLVKTTSTCAATSAGELAALRAFGDQFIHRRPAAVVHHQRKTGFENIAGDGLAHQPQANVADSEHGVWDPFTSYYKGFGIGDW